MPFSETTKQKVKERAHFRCCLCRKNWATEVHHITPEAEGGLNTEENAAPLCANCHDLYGGNRDKRKFIEQSRDFWYDFCRRDSPAFVQQFQEMLDTFGQRMATKEDLQEAVDFLGAKIQNIMSQPLPAAKKVQLVADTTTAFSHVLYKGLCLECHGAGQLRHGENIIRCPTCGGSGNQH